MKQDYKTLVLLDSHAIIHRAYHALPEFASSKGEPTGALFGLSTMLLNLLKQFKPDYVVATFDLPGPTYRHEAYKEYKAGRKKGDDELIAQLNRSRDVLEAFGIPIYDMPGFEADDMLGTIVEIIHNLKFEINNCPLRVIIASGDMDTMQLIEGDKVKVFTLKKGIKDTVVYNEKAVIDRFGFAPKYLPDYKGLRGDPSDNIPGIKGIGEKTATTLISAYHTIEAMYKVLKKKGGKEKMMEETGISDRLAELIIENEEEAKFSKALATIRRDAPIDFKLPATSFKESFDIQKVEKLFDELEFRTLGARVRSVILDEKVSEAPERREMVNVDIGYDPIIFQEASIMLSLVDSNILSPDTDEIMRYTKADTLPQAHQILTTEVEKRGQTRVWQEIEKPLIPVLETMKKIGIKLDVPYLAELSAEYHQKLAVIEAQIYAYAGRELNINSPKQLGEVLFVEMGLKGKRQKKTAGGALSTKESELEKIKDLHPIVAEILKHRELQKLLSTYIDVLPTLADKQGRLHTSLIQIGAATGRMASTNPNLQNIPIKSELGRAIRKAFISEEGYSLVSIDYSQMELRIAAFLSKDPKMIEIFTSGEDVHTAVAARVFKVKESEVDKEMRRKAKVINFGILYGMGVTALKDNLGGTREEAQTFYNTYFETFDRLSAYLSEIKAETARKGYTETFYGRRRYIEGANSKLPFVRSMAERAAINAPIQGTEADVIKLAMVRIDEWLKAHSLQPSARMLLQVHDELVFEIKKGEEKEMVSKIREIMESIIDPKETSGIILTTEASKGENWNEMEEIK